MGEQLGAVTDPNGPRDLAVEAVLGLARDRQASLAGVLAERLGV